MGKFLVRVFIFCAFLYVVAADGSTIISGAFTVVSPPCDGAESMLGWCGDLSYVGDKFAFSGSMGKGSASYDEGFEGLPGETEYSRYWLSASGGLRILEVAGFNVYPTVLFSYGTSKQHGIYRGYFKYPDYHYGMTTTDVESDEHSFIFGFAFGRYGGYWPTLHLMFGAGWRRSNEEGLLLKTAELPGDDYSGVFVVDEWNYDMVVGMRVYAALALLGPVGISTAFEGIIAPRDEVFIDWNREIFKKRVWVGRDITAWIGPSVAF
jgi:hypothetical protein